MSYRITAPVAGFTGAVAGMDFARGVAEGDPSPGALAYFRRHGYSVEEIAAGPAVEEDPAGRLPARSASKADWRAYAVAHGMSEEDADAATRDQLAAHFHEHHAEQDD